MKKFKEKIEKNYDLSISRYKNKFSSKHWTYNNQKKIKLFKSKNLENFRNNDLSKGLDDQYHTQKQMKDNFKKLIKDCGEKFVLKNLSGKNIGNVKNYYKHKGKIVDKHEIFFIKFLKDISKYIKKRNSIICEIGAGYGVLASKIIKNYKCKYIIIDLPESNFMSAFYLKKIFPKKKIFLSMDIKKKKITNTDFKKNDIFILTPWDKLPKTKVDFFINTRSMMEMDYKVIKKYFDLIHYQILQGGYFLNINRYYKDTTGFPIEFHKYPYDKKWKIIESKKSWQQDHIHFLLTKRINKESKDLQIEMSNIYRSMKIAIKKDERMIRRILPNIIYKTYKMIKNIYF